MLSSGPHLHTRADAYLSEDRIYYGADTYNINYKDEIVNARGKAYFRRDTLSVRAREITIYYGENEKKAYFFDRVKIRDTEENYELLGDYAEAHFREEFLLVENNVEFINDRGTVSAGKGESRGMETFTFKEDVSFISETLHIESQSLDVNKDDTALFREEVHVSFLENGDDLYCRTLIYGFATGDSEFREDVVYIQREETEQEEPLIITSGIAQLYSDDDLFLLMDGVYITNGTYSLTAPMVKFYRESGVIESIGETIINDGSRSIYCDRMELFLDEKRIAFFGEIQGIFNLE
jgi:lipopolysaccharide assembly outer membrane protein LptD (OstA)